MTTIHATEEIPTHTGKWRPLCACGWTSDRDYALRRDARMNGARHARYQTLAEMEERRRRRDDDEGIE